MATQPRQPAHKATSSRDDRDDQDGHSTPPAGSHKATSSRDDRDDQDDQLTAATKQPSQPAHKVTSSQNGPGRPGSQDGQDSRTTFEPRQVPRPPWRGCAAQPLACGVASTSSIWTSRDHGFELYRAVIGELCCLPMGFGVMTEPVRPRGDGPKTIVSQGDS